MTVNSIDPTDIKQNPNIRFTDAAIAHFSKQLAASEHESIRLFIEVSGCSGYMYRLELVSEPQPDDVTIELADGLKLYVQGEAIAILQGTEVDFRKEGLNELLMFNNPNVTGECGCGESFVVESEARDNA